MHLISYQSTISAHCTEQYSSDAPQLSGVDSLQISSQQNWPKKELLLQGSQWEVFALLSNSRSINSGQGKAAHWDATWDFILKMHLCNTCNTWPCAAIEQATLSSPSTNKTLYQNSKNKPNKKNTPMWESSLSQASFHSLFEVTLNCRWQRWKAWHSTVQRGKGVGKEGLFPEKNH